MYTRRCKKENILLKNKLVFQQYRINLAKLLIKYDGRTIEPNLISPGTAPRPSSRASSCTDMLSSCPADRGESSTEPSAKKYRPVISQPITEVRLGYV